MRMDAGSMLILADGSHATVADLVIDPVRQRLTHLVVVPPARRQGSRLVPFGALTGDSGLMGLSWSAADLLGAPEVDEEDLLEPNGWPHTEDGWEVGVITMLPWPSYGAPEGVGYGQWVEPGFGDRPPTAARYDRIPAGCVEIRRLSDVLGSDRLPVGYVRGLTVGPDGELVELIVDQGHLWARHDLTVPFEQVESVLTDQVRLRAGATALKHHRLAC